MESKNYIKCLKTKKRDAVYVAMRQALCYYFFTENIPCHIIAQVMNCSRRNVYMSVYRAKDLLEVGDKTIKKALDEIKNHSIRIVPCTIDGSLLSRHIGNKLVIDNIIL